MTEVSMKCGYCRWIASLTADAIRADQDAYMAIWQHVMASHHVEARELRTLSIAHRKEVMLSWTTSHPSTLTTATSQSTGA